MGRGVVAALVAMALVMTACGSGDRSGEPATTAESAVPTTPPTDSSATYDAIGPESAEPSHLNLSLEDEAKATVEIGPDGEEVSATSEAGVSFTLAVPAGAVLSPTAITLTPVASATGMTVGNAPLAMVHLAPEGFTFAQTGTMGSTSVTHSHTESGTTGTVEQTVSVAYKGA